MEAGLEPPYSCRSGICSTCRAKLISGKVKMDEREGLTEDEIKMGYILTCQSHPLTSNVKVDYE
jgi:ring-1,2-phenylacetyl-CoA epoxidase subunit PaaE